MIQFCRGFILSALLFSQTLESLCAEGQSAYLTPFGRKVVSLSLACITALSVLAIFGPPDIPNRFERQNTFGRIGDVRLISGVDEVRVGGALSSGKPPSELDDQYADWIKEGLKKFPPELLSQLFDRIYVGQSLHLNGVRIGGFSGTLGQRWIIVEGLSRREDFMDLLYHEVGHKMLTSFWRKFDWRKFASLNPPDFKYFGDSLEFLENRPSFANQPNDQLWRLGFFRPYSVASFNEDFANLFAEIFRNDPRFWKSLHDYPILKEKTDLILDLLGRVDHRLVE
jgi:hypothetical protein